MNGTYEYLAADYSIRTCWNSNEIPSDAIEVLKFQPKSKDAMKRIGNWNITKSRVYGKEIESSEEEDGIEE